MLRPVFEWGGPMLRPVFEWGTNVEAWFSNGRTNVEAGFRMAGGRTNALAICTLKERMAGGPDRRAL